MSPCQLVWQGAAPAKPAAAPGICWAKWIWPLAAPPIRKHFPAANNSDSPWPEARLTFPPDKVWKASFEAEPLLVYEGEFAILADQPLPVGLDLPQ